MKDTRDFLKESLLKLSKSRNKEDFSRYIKGCVFDYVVVSDVKWVDDKKIVIHTDFLPFIDENISEVGVDKYFGFVGDHMEKFINVDTDDTDRMRRTGNLLDILFAVSLKNDVKELVVKEVVNQAQVFKENVSKGFDVNIEVDVVVRKTKVFTNEVIEFIKNN